MKKKIPQLLLIVALILVIVGSFFASMFNTGVFATKVDRISFETERGTLSGLLYMPKGASEKDPRATVIVTHGYKGELFTRYGIEIGARFT